MFYIGFLAPILADFDQVMYGVQCGQSRFLDVGCLMTQTREHLNSVLSKSVLLNTARSARRRLEAPGDAWKRSGAREHARSTPFVIIYLNQSSERYMKV